MLLQTPCLFAFVVDQKLTWVQYYQMRVVHMFNAHGSFVLHFVTVAQTVWSLIWHKHRKLNLESVYFPRYMHSFQVVSSQNALQHLVPVVTELYSTVWAPLSNLSLSLRRFIFFTSDVSQYHRMFDIWNFKLLQTYNQLFKKSPQGLKEKSFFLINHNQSVISVDTFPFELVFFPFRHFKNSCQGALKPFELQTQSCFILTFPLFCLNPQIKLSHEAHLHLVIISWTGKALK